MDIKVQRLNKVYRGNVRALNSMQYRVVGALSMQPGVQPAEPTLEDGYVWLMQEQPAPAGAAF